jgi:hypothetical protein
MRAAIDKVLATLTRSDDPDAGDSMCRVVKGSVAFEPSPYAGVDVDLMRAPDKGQMLVLHATGTSTLVDSVLRHGFLLPGSRHPFADWHIPVVNGALYGSGIYTSDVTNFKMSLPFGFFDADTGTSTLVLCLLTLGEVRYRRHA